MQHQLPVYSYLLFLFAPNTEKHLHISSKESTSIPLKRVRNAYWPEDDSVRSGRAGAEKRTCLSTDKSQLKNSWRTFFFPQNLPQLCCYGVFSSGPPPTPIPLHLPVLPTDFLSCDVIRGLSFPSWASLLGLTLHPQHLTQVLHYTPTCSLP